MPRTRRAAVEIDWDQAAQDYLSQLPLEHFMEATAQARQREITLESLALVKPRRPDFHVFNELLVQYPRNSQRKPGQVVPDNMVVLYEGEIHAEGSYNLPKQPAGPFWVLEYVSKSNRRKDYDDNFNKYERELKVPYYLLFVPDQEEMTLYRHSGRKYVTVLPDKQGRVALAEVELEVGLHEGWVRFWFRGDLLALPADLLHQLEEAREREEEWRKRAAEEARRAKQQTRRANQQTRRANEQTRRANEQMQKAKAEASRRRDAEAEVAQLRGELEKMRRQSSDE